MDIITSILLSRRIILALLLTSIVLSAASFLVSRQWVQTLQKYRFDHLVADQETLIRHHLTRYDSLLLGVAAFFSAVNIPDRNAFASYVKSLNLDRDWPGVQVVGYSLSLQADSVALHTRSMQDQGFPEYHIKPLGQREQYSSVIYVEPFDWRNRVVMGYDMLTNNERRIAMEKARESGRLSSTGQVVLLQDADKPVTDGFITYFPLFIDERFQGWLFVTFRIGGMLSGWLAGNPDHLSFSLYDGEPEDPAAMMWSNGEAYSDSAGALFSKSLEIDMNGQDWTLMVRAEPDFFRQENWNLIPLWVTGISILVDVLLALLVFSLHARTRRAEQDSQQHKLQLEKAEQDLESQREFSDAIIDSLPVVLYVMNLNSGSVVRLNRYARRNLDSDGAIAPLFEQFQLQVNNHRRRAGSDYSESYLSRIEAETVEGKRSFNLHQVPIRNAQGQPDFLVIIANDITERLESERQFTLLFDSAPTGLMLVDRDQHISLVNKALADMFAYQPGDLVGKPVEMLVPEDARHRHRGHLDTFLHSPSPRRLGSRSDIRGVTRDKREIVLDLGLQPLKYSGEYDVLVSVMDISDRHRLIQQLEKANRYKSEFLASMSHELRTPLNAIIGFTERVLKSPKAELPERERDGLETVFRNAQHLLSLINDILDLSKVESGHMELKLEPLDVRQLVDWQLQALAPGAKARDLQFKVRLPSSPVPMVSDKNLLLRILNNLVSNAIKYTMQGSVTVTLTVSYTAEWGQTLNLQVDDTGIGILPHDQQKLFNEFVRVNEAREKNIEGTGLGLAITSRLVSLLGGRIEVDSEHGVGSSFRVLLPMRRRAGMDSQQKLTYGDGQPKY